MRSRRPVRRPTSTKSSKVDGGHEAQAAELDERKDDDLPKARPVAAGVDDDEAGHADRGGAVKSASMRGVAWPSLAEKGSISSSVPTAMRRAKRAPARRPARAAAHALRRRDLVLAGLLAADADAPIAGLLTGAGSVLRCRGCRSSPGHGPGDSEGRLVGQIGGRIDAVQHSPAGAAGPMQSLPSAVARAAAAGAESAHERPAAPVPIRTED